MQAYNKHSFTSVHVRKLGVVFHTLFSTIRNHQVNYTKHLHLTLYVFVMLQLYSYHSLKVLAIDMKNSSQVLRDASTHLSISTVNVSCVIQFFESHMFTPLRTPNKENLKARPPAVSSYNTVSQKQSQNKQYNHQFSYNKFRRSDFSRTASKIVEN